MTCVWFQLLLKFLNFSDISLKTDTDRLFKVRPLPDELRGKFQQLYTAGKAVDIDESLIPFRGRLSLKRYIPGKFRKYGFKLIPVTFRSIMGNEMTFFLLVMRSRRSLSCQKIFLFSGNLSLLTTFMQSVPLTQHSDQGPSPPMYFD